MYDVTHDVYDNLVLHCFQVANLIPITVPWGVTSGLSFYAELPHLQVPYPIPCPSHRRHPDSSGSTSDPEEDDATYVYGVS